MAAIADLDILIVDDHEAMRTLLRTVLLRAGALNVREAPNAATALTLLAERPVALMLVDQSMPGMDGTALVARARADGCIARIVMITGHADGRHTEAAMAAGVDALLVKPVTPRALIETLERVLGA
jgi:two-component system chemotaxis response regulator CheY